ncbi:MAG: relaxase/mobilization nuclease domain-containing protein [Phenylobacterium sp.]|nr:relaxase/mobilization nuclease domain-containing protein [Phenylobacterium sp.]
MLVRQAIEARLSGANGREEEGPRVRLPRSMKRDRQGVRTALYQRLAASRLFALGDRSGVLKAAQGRSGRAFRLDVRQRVIVKALVCRHKGKGAVRGAALARHVAYLGRSGAGVEGARPEFFDRDAEGLNAVERTGGWGADRHHFRFIISPEHGDRIDDLKGYVGEVMARVSADLGEPGLAWIGTCHFDTDQPHAHVLVRGKRDDGRDLVIPRDYIGYGFRARAQEVAQERLGDLSRAEAERRIWKETGVDRFTGFDRRLLAAADQDGLVDDGVGRSDAWAALTRGRLRHLEKLGLASPFGHRYRLAADLEVKLRTLQIRQDVIRTLNQRRLEGARNVQQLGDQKVRGRVVRSGSHDELGGAAYVIVRDRAGTEHYARLAFGRSSPKLGAQVELMPGPKGAQILGLGRSTAERGL